MIKRKIVANQQKEKKIWVHFFTLLGSLLYSSVKMLTDKTQMSLCTRLDKDIIIMQLFNTTAYFDLNSNVELPMISYHILNLSNKSLGSSIDGDELEMSHSPFQMLSVITGFQYP